MREIPYPELQSNFLHLIHHADGVPHEDIPTRIEARSRNLEGYFSQFLREDFLAAYMDILREDYPEKTYLQHLPEVINDLLVPICESHASEKNGWHVELISSGAKYIAYPMSLRHWGAKRYFREQLNKLHACGNGDNSITPQEAETDLAVSKEQKEQELAKFFGTKYGLTADPDLDPLVPSAAEAMRRLVDHFLPHDDDCKKGQKNTDTCTFKYDDHFTIACTLLEPPPTAPWVKLLEVEIIDTHSGVRMFHLDIGEPPQKGSEIELDKRRGKTTKKQESVKASLSVKNDQIYYTMPYDSAHVLAEQDELQSESDNPNALMEIFFRGLRMNILHEVKHILMKDGSVCDLPNLKMFFPYFTSDTILPFRRKLQDLLFEGHTLSDGNKDLLKREVALCLTLDPYMTIQAFRDTGIGQFIPGLKYASLDQWEQILTSRHLVVGTDAYQKADRTYKTMEKERLMYLYGSNNGSEGHYNGVEMFMKALVEEGIIKSDSGEDYWSQYLDLWKEKAYEKPRYLASTTNLSELSRDGWYGDDTFDEKTTYQAYLRMENIKLLIDILSQYPIGLTPRDLERLYIGKEAGIPKVQNIREIFCDLKLMGLISLHKTERIYKDRKFIGGIARYTLRPVQSMQTIESIMMSGDFQTFLQREMYPDMPDEEFHRLTATQSLIVDTFLQTGKIRFLQALETLQKKDVETILARIYKLDRNQTILIPEKKIEDWMAIISDYAALCHEYLIWRGV